MAMWQLAGRTVDRDQFSYGCWQLGHILHWGEQGCTLLPSRSECLLRGVRHPRCAAGSASCCCECACHQQCALHDQQIAQHFSSKDASVRRPCRGSVYCGWRTHAHLALSDGLYHLFHSPLNSAPPDPQLLLAGVPSPTTGKSRLNTCAQAAQIPFNSLPWRPMRVWYANLSNCAAAPNEIGVVGVDVGMLAIDDIADHALGRRCTAVYKLLHLGNEVCLHRSTIHVIPMHKNFCNILETQSPLRVATLQPARIPAKS